jgi:SagB-type dehydrogenase family enzyme
MSSTFRSIAEHAWTYHRATCRWTYNSSHPGDDDAENANEHLGAPYLPLPPPAPADAALGDLLDARLSCRSFSSEPLTTEDLSSICGAAYGVHHHVNLNRVLLPERGVPSGGALYPLELYVLVGDGGPVPAGVHHYVPHTHGLEHLRDVALPTRYVEYLFMNQRWFAEAGAVLVLTAVVRRTARKYGDRGYRYLLLEAGHVAQTIVLSASARDLGTCCGGGFLDDELAGVLTADVEDEVPVYAIAVGHPSTADRVASRLV